MLEVISSSDGAQSPSEVVRKIPEVEGGVETQLGRALLEAEWQLVRPVLEQSRNSRVLVLSPFRRLHYVNFIPFQIHLDDPDAATWLPLTPTITVIPGRPAFWDTVHYRVSDAFRARNAVRLARVQQGRNLDLDLVWPDWEEGVSRHRQYLLPKSLPPYSYMRVGRLKSNGQYQFLPRPVLGNRAAKHNPQPRVLIPGDLALGEEVIQALASTDLVVVDVQGLRGSKILRTIHAVMRARPVDAATLIFASSPSDVFSADLQDTAQSGRVVVIGTLPDVERVVVRTVTPERLALEARFDDSLADMDGRGERVEAVKAQAVNAWWALHHRMDVAGGMTVVARFDQELEELSREDPANASLFRACHALLHGLASANHQWQTRLKIVVETVTGSEGTGDVVVLTRTAHDADVVRSAVATCLGVTVDELTGLGIRVLPIRARALPTGETVVAAVYTGMATLDAIFSVRPRVVHLVVDPVEAQIAWYQTRQMVTYLHSVDAHPTARSLEALENALGPFVIGHSARQELAMAVGDVEARGLRPSATPPRPGGSEATIGFADGSYLQVPLGTRFEVVGHHGQPSHAATPRELQSGDEVVLLNDDVQIDFSERRIRALDAGPLRGERRVRDTWLSLIRDVVQAQQLTATAIKDAMNRQGYRVTETTVRTWLRANDADAMTPNDEKGFHALAAAVGLPLPPETVHSYFEQIRRWRVRHQQAGRQVARAIRLAYTGRLTTRTLARIEADWGVEISRLVMAARVATVDDVLLPEAHHDE